MKKFLLFVLIFLIGVNLFSFKRPVETNPFQNLVTIKPYLRVSETYKEIRELTELLTFTEDAMRFFADNGYEWQIVIDQRRGAFSIIDGGAIPIIPGLANNLDWNEIGNGCSSISCIPKTEIEKRLRSFISRYPNLFVIPQEELVLDEEGTIPVGDSIYLARFQWVKNGIPVEKGSLFFIINNGNLIQIASTRISSKEINTTPFISLNTAYQILKNYLGEFNLTDKDEIINPGYLVIIPITKIGYDPNVYSGPIGEMIDYKLAYRIVFRKEKVPGTWEALIDAHTGEILRFVDVNRYGKIQGGVYKTDKYVTQVEETVPFPFANYGTDLYADIGGNFPGTTGISTMTGRSGSSGNVGGAVINDNCGSISLSADANGLIDFGTSPGTDCVTPGIGGAGNTHSARTQYYNVTWAKIRAYNYFPNNSWLQGVLQVNVNINNTCNASWNGTALNFYRSGGGCNNTGELPGVSIHEWGHGMDDFDGSGGDSPPVETRADFTAILHTRTSCPGAGFFVSWNLGCGQPPNGSGYNCDGYGDCCLDCSGVREADWDKHASHTPWTIANYGTIWSGCDSGWYFGPCGKEDHCESGIATQALWDLVNRDLPTYCGMDLPSAWQLAERLFYTSMPQLGDMYTCTPPNSNGCGGTSLFNLFRAIDDDGDGTSNGTPHAQAIFQAFNRHMIACGNANDQSNQNQTSCPSLSKPILSGQVGSNSVTLNWSSVNNATRYFIFRNDTDCDAGFVKIATVNAPITTYTDSTCTNGITSYYRIQAATGNDSCVSPVSDCVAITPQPCAGSITLNRSIYNCSDQIIVRVTDSTPSSPVTVQFWSNTDNTVKSITLTEVSSGIFEGSFYTTTGSPQANEVKVTDNDTIFVRYLDPDYCGIPNYEVLATVNTDCTPPIITNISISNITGHDAVVTFTTNEPAKGSVYYDTNFPPFMYSINEAIYFTNHTLTLLNLTECTKYYYYVTAIDMANNVAVDNNNGSYYNFKSIKDSIVTFEKIEDPPLPIPDGDLVNGASSVINVPINKPIVDVNVKINISHTYDGDLDIYLIAPDNTIVELSTDNGGSGDNYIDTIFDDEATTPITSGSPPFTGTFKPEGQLSTLYGKMSQGDWILRVYDDDSLATGVINNWSIEFTFPQEQCPSSEGVVFFDDDVYGCNNDDLTITLLDEDLLGTGSTVVSVSSDYETTPEQVILIEDPPSSATFKGSIQTTTLPPVHGDNKISTQSGNLVYVKYIDADNGSGGQNIEVTDNATIDCEGPVITNVHIVQLAGNFVKIGWNTDTLANSIVYYGETIPPSQMAFDPTLTTDHLITITGLNQCSVYYFFVVSEDVFGNPSIDDNNGNYYSFETLGGGFNIYSYTTPTPIADLNTIEVPITITDSGTITDVDVLININHTYDADLDIYLVHPDGTIVELSTDNGGSGDNYIDTIFDDSASTPITSGSAPFTGRYRPESPLSVLNGKELAGTWKLRITDDASGDTGTLNYYQLHIIYSNFCGPALEYSSNSTIDSCVNPSPGNGDGKIDAGEDVQIVVSLTNIGISDATNVRAILETTSPYVTIIDNEAQFPDIPVGQTQSSLAPHFKIRVASNTPCGESLPFVIKAMCNETLNVFEGEFSLTCGNIVTNQTSIFIEDFESSNFPPPDWNKVRVSGSCADWLWNSTTHHPSGQPPYSGNGLTYFNSYHCSSGSARLFRTVLDTIPANANSARIDFYMYHDTGFSTYQDRIQVQISFDGSNWINVGDPILRYDGSVGWKLHSVDLSQYIGNSIYIGFLGITAYGNDCHLDKVTLLYTTSECYMDICESCITPTQPQIVKISDGNPCLQNGLYIDYIPGTPATRHDLYVDGQLAAQNIYPNYFYNPNDTQTHSYRIRAINEDELCYNESPSVDAQDINQSPTTAPEIISIIDPDPLTFGLIIEFNPGSPADRHDLYVDGIKKIENITSGATIIVGDNLVHSFQVGAVLGECVLLSDPVVASDRGSRFRPRPRVPIPDDPIPPLP